MRRGSGRKNPLPAVLFLLAVALASGSSSEAASQPGRETLIVTQAPSGGLRALATGLPGVMPPDGARLVSFSPTGVTRVLTPGFAAAADPEVSFDGTRLLFAGKRAAQDPWCIFEMKPDGSEARRITCGPGEARSPLYLPTMYTLTETDTEAWTQIAFVGTTPGEWNEAGTAPNTSIYACRTDGTSLRRLTFNLSNDQDPTLLPDGRILYASTERHGLEWGQAGRVILAAINTDGTDQIVFAADEGQQVKRMPCVTGDGQVFLVEKASLEKEAAGRLAAVSLRRNLHSHRSVSAEADGLFLWPAPLRQGALVVAYKPSQGAQGYGLYRFETASGVRTLILDDPRWDEIQARPLAPRPVPDGRSSAVRDDDPLGKFYGLDANLTDLGAEWPKGEGRRLRVVEGLARLKDQLLPSGMVTRRILGEVALAEDSSFHLQLPANTPVQVQLLDRDGLALRTSSWIWTRNHENRGCIGCHEDRERTPANRFAKALAEPAAELTSPAERRRTVDFVRDVRPIVEHRCTVCHGAGGERPLLDPGPAGAREPSPAYRTLISAYLQPGRARASRVIWHLLGRNTARPWDLAEVGQTGRPRPAASPVTEDEVRTIAEWIDLGALWEAVPPDAAPAPLVSHATATGGTK
jgi:hypothetical protein